MANIKSNNKTILIQAIKNSDILPSGQKKILAIISASDYSVTAKQIEKAMGFTKQTVNFTLKNLLARNFVERKKDGVYMYTANKERSVELIERYKSRMMLLTTL